MALLILFVAAWSTVLWGCAKNVQRSTSTGTMQTGGGPQSVAGADAARGKALFTQNCSSCHGATGVEGGVGPSLRNEKSRKNTAAAIAWIENPQPPMPKLYPSPLSDKDVADLAAYVETL